MKENRPLKVLIIAPSWIGDAVLSHSLIQNLKINDPEMIIDVGANYWTSDIYRRMPEVINIIELPTRHGKLGLLGILKKAKEIKKLNYDQAYILPRSIKSALIPFFSGIKKRTGFLGEKRYGILNDIRSFDPKRLDQTIKRFHALAEDHSDGAFNLFQPKLIANKERGMEILESHGLDATKRFIALAPGAEYGKSKMWPTKYFNELGLLIEKNDFNIYVFGSPKEQALSEKILKGLNHDRCFSFAGKTSLIESIDILSLSESMVTNDSGLMHLGASVGVPVVAIYGSTSPEFTPPMTDQKSIHWLNIECSPCFKRECAFGHYECLNSIKPDVILNSLQNLIRS
jgi:heptosyltransferase-2